MELCGTNIVLFGPRKAAQVWFQTFTLVLPAIEFVFLIPWHYIVLNSIDNTEKKTYNPNLSSVVKAPPEPPTNPINPSLHSSHFGVFIEVIHVYCVAFARSFFIPIYFTVMLLHTHLNKPKNYVSVMFQYSNNSCSE